MVVDVVSNEKEALHEKVNELVGERMEMKQEMKRLAARFTSHVRRQPQKIDTAVQRALSSAAVTHQTAYEIEIKSGGIIQNWARGVILNLVCACDVPAAKTWAAFSCSVGSLPGVQIKGSWSPRSAGRHVVLEGALAAEEMIIEATVLIQIVKLFLNFSNVREKLVKGK